MLIRQFRGDATTWSALQESNLEQKRFVDVFNRVDFLTQDSGDRVDTHRSPVEFVDNRPQKPPICFVKAMLIDVQQPQRVTRNRVVDLAVTADFSKIPRSLQQPVGDARCSTGALRNLGGPRDGDWGLEDVGGPPDNNLKVRLRETWLQGEFEARFALALGAKDLGLASALAAEVGVPMEMVALCEADLQEAMARGWGGEDTSKVLLLQEERAGVEVRLPKEEAG